MMCMLTKQGSKHRNALHEACVWICDAHKDGEPNPWLPTYLLMRNSALLQGS